MEKRSTWPCKPLGPRRSRAPQWRRVPREGHPLSRRRRNSDGSMDKAWGSREILLCLGPLLFREFGVLGLRLLGGLLLGPVGDGVDSLVRYAGPLQLGPVLILALFGLGFEPVTPEVLFVVDRLGAGEAVVPILRVGPEDPAQLPARGGCVDALRLDMAEVKLIPELFAVQGPVSVVINYGDEGVDVGVRGKQDLPLVVLYVEGSRVVGVVSVEKGDLLDLHDRAARRDDGLFLDSVAGESAYRHHKVLRSRVSPP